MILKVAVIVGATLLALPAMGQQKVTPQHTPIKAHRVVIQVTQNDPALMNVALNNAENLTDFYKAKGETVDIEFVAYGPGLTMMRDDISPVKDRLAQINGARKNIVFTGCQNTLDKAAKQEEKSITLVPQARIVPAGIARVVELEEQGWTYVRP